MSSLETSLRRCALALAIIVLALPSLQASDHADPIETFRRVQQEGGITDLFVFPEADATGEPIVDERGRPRNLVVVLCVRRALGFTPDAVTDSSYVTLEPYTYNVYMDLSSAVNIGDDTDQNTVRYGGTVARPDQIRPDVAFTIRLRRPMVDGTVPLREPLEVNGLRIPSDRITFYSGIRDDPFIFPNFFGTNVVAMLMKIPMEAFPETQDTWVVWATSSRDGKQIDHVGRSLRTQNPRFELLNTLEPKDHVAAITRAEEHPDLVTNILLNRGLVQTFAYRPWDKVPDVLIYSLRRPLGFPNGRRLTDDVARQLAEHGDTLLYEISYMAPMFPRATTNDKPFLPEFPYLAAPHVLETPNRPPIPLTTENRLKLLGIALAIVGAWLLTAWLLAVWYHRRQLRHRYL